jgi:hypothetical protein
MRRRWLSAVVVTGACALASTAYAEDTPQKREAAAAQKFASATALSQRFGHYTQAREDLLTGDGSLKARSVAWQEAATNWTRGWLQVLALADLQLDVPYEQFEAKLAELLKAQADALSDLTKRSADIEAQGTTILAGVPEGPGADAYPNLANADGVLAALAQREGELRTAIATTAGIPKARIASFAEIDTQSRRAVLARLRAALLARGRYPLDTTLAAVSSLLDAEKVVDPLLASIGRAENEMNAYALNLQVFHAEDAIAPARATCADAKAKIAAVKGAPRFVQGAAGRADQLCRAIETHYADLGAIGVPKADFVTEYLNVEKASFPAACRGATPPAACMKLAVIAALSSADLHAMTDARLRFIELQWAENVAAVKRRGGAS